MRSIFQRQSEINRLRSELELTGFPRLKMFFIVGLTGGAGFLSSFLMLQYCAISMGIRYPAAIGFAYLAFLFLLWLWLRTSASDYTDVPDLSNIPTPHGGLSDCAVEAPIVTDDGGAIPETAEVVAQAEEFAVPLLVILVAGTALFSSMWIVYSAPTLFAELLVDGVLSASLYRKLRGLETRHWLTTAIRKTIWPFVITAVISGFGGMALHKLYPEARSLGEVIRAHEERLIDQSARPARKAAQVP